MSSAIPRVPGRSTAGVRARRKGIRFPQTERTHVNNEKRCVRYQAACRRHRDMWDDNGLHSRRSASGFPRPVNQCYRSVYCVVIYKTVYPIAADRDRPQPCRKSSHSRTFRCFRVSKCRLHVAQGAALTALLRPRYDADAHRLYAAWHLSAGRRSVASCRFPSLSRHKMSFRCRLINASYDTPETPIGR